MAAEKPLGMSGSFLSPDLEGVWLAAAAAAPVLARPAAVPFGLPGEGVASSPSSLDEALAPPSAPSGEMVPSSPAKAGSFLDDLILRQSSRVAAAEANAAAESHTSEDMLLGGAITQVEIRPGEIDLQVMRS